MPVLTRRQIHIGLASAVASTTLPCIGRAADRPGLKLGMVVPLSGPSARFDGFASHGAELAVKQINAAGGVNGAPVTLTRGDSQGTSVESVSAARRMLSDTGYQAILGDIASSATIALQR
jgi:branched-chain amino acid transport system substrate-binding protein